MLREYGVDATCYSPSNRYIPAEKFVSMLIKVNHSHSQWVLDSDKGVCCYPSLHSLFELDRQTKLS